MSTEAHLTGELPRSHLYQKILTITFFIVWILDSFVLQFSTFLTESVPLLMRGIFSVMLIVTSLYLIKKSNNALFGTKTVGLRTNGIYAKVRHPMYLGAILLVLGLTVLTLSLATFVVWFVIIAFCDTLATYEERLLLEQFGDEFILYKERVSKWNPI